jgi:hypothetical protein
MLLQCNIEFFDQSFHLRGEINVRIVQTAREVNPSALQPESCGLPSTRAQAEGLRVDPERRFSTTPSKAGLGAVERVNFLLGPDRLPDVQQNS